MTKRRKMLSLDEANALDPLDMPGSQDIDQAPQGQSSDPHEEDELTLEQAWDDSYQEESSPRDKILTLLCFVLAAGWIGFFAWARQDNLLADPSPSLLVSTAFELIVPILLIAIIWQLLIRSSRSEQARFADTAQMLSRESADLETRLITINRELSLARDFIASQSRDLESLGRVAADRLSASAATLQGLIADNNQRVESIGQVSQSAVSNMEKLRDQMPVLANSARDMTNQVGNVGNVADRQISAMVEAMQQLDEFGASGETHVEKITAIIASALADFERQSTDLGNGALSTFEAINRQSEDFQRDILERDRDAVVATQNRARELEEFLEGRNARLLEIEEKTIITIRSRVSDLAHECDTILLAMGDRREEASDDIAKSIAALETRLNDAIARVAKIDEEALASARKRLNSLAQEAERIDASVAESSAGFEAELARRQEAAQAKESQALAALEERLAQFDQRMSQRAQDHVDQAENLAERGEQIAQRLTQVDDDIGRLATRFDTTQDTISASAEILAERLSLSRQVLDENSTSLLQLTDDSVRLLEILRSSGEHADETVLAAIGRAEQQLGVFRSDAEALSALIEQAETRGASLAAHVEATQENGSSTLALLERLAGKLGVIAEKSTDLAQQTRADLQASIKELGVSSAKVLQDLRDGQGEAIREVADTIAAKSNEAIALALNEEAGASIAQLEQAAQRAAEAGKETSRQLRDQLSIVNELTGNLEQRVAVAREKAEEKVDHDFTRRMALITQALNSSAIDISRAFDEDVSDTQWTHYLRGDRGIFTRRAVRLLDKQEARAVFDVYEDDSEFRETANRYIHDFEAMLRTVLSTRDGNAVAVTLLSSDIGKLYVSLAQAIERLRD